MDKRKFFVIALTISILVLLIDWLLVAPMKHWWLEIGVQLPGVTVSWLEPTWHVIAGIVLIGSAVLIRVPQFFGVGIALWITTHVLYLILLAMVFIMPFIRVGSLNELSH